MIVSDRRLCAVVIQGYIVKSRVSISSPNLEDCSFDQLRAANLGLSPPLRKGSRVLTTRGRAATVPLARPLIRAKFSRASNGLGMRSHGGVVAILAM